MNLLSIFVYNDLKITITRGDSGLVRLAILEDGEESPFTNGADEVRFAVKEYPGASESIFETTITQFIDGVAEIIIPSSATQGVSVGNYIYGIQWIDDGEVRTIVPGADFLGQYPIFEIVPEL